MHKFLLKLGFAALALVAISCGEVKKVTYFQDAADGQQIELAKSSKVVAQPHDQLSIIISSRNPELSGPLNLPIVTYQAGSKQPGFDNSRGDLAAYTIDGDGNIDMPLLGTVHVAGLCRGEIATVVKTLILSKNLLKDPVVIVDFSNMYVSVVGDIKTPGRVSLDKDKMTVLDVLAKAGDLNISGVRIVKVFREKDGVQNCYEIDLTSAEKVFKSPAYYVMQDDVIYVVPNGMKARSSTVNGNTLISASFWISLGSLATSIAALIVNLQLSRQ